ncbi:glycosyltransferase family 4 protein [Hymenobacter actinosclerus]|uniref:Glycosyltransferase involved in cell wall bisynthesis n=1 Tax=Hymenobacter actinosclerus TaxID=82805 RepID=A0A1I0J5L0_9BACT|nr:glycosyltransferase family 1 protein [Hymenobacter actinosclerus]SEU04276.1 Glycosyltransferase involved in cell wall bisynthesis [Hymenobacter actinosclerus]
MLPQLQARKNTPLAAADPAPDRPLRIGIEAQRLFRPHKHGMDIVALELIRNLQQLDHTNEYFVFVKPDQDNTVLRETPNFRIVEIAGGPYPFWEQVLLPRAARQAGLDVLHCTSNTAPLRLAMPLLLTLHDIIYLEPLDLRRGSWYQRLGNLYRRWNVPRVLPHCERVFTVSAFEQGRILERLPALAGRVQVVYNSAGEQFGPVAGPAALAAAKARYRLPDRFIFFLANTDPKKNLRGVLQAVALLKARGQLQCQLVMLDYQETALTALLRELGAPDLRADILLCGYVPNQELPLIYQLAEVFLYPSLRESFGIPILEAMGCGTPVITSTTSSMPEVAGEAALLVDPFQPEAIASAILKLQNEPATRAALVERGRQRVRQFSWREAARQVQRVYQQVGRPAAAATPP